MAGEEVQEMNAIEDRAYTIQILSAELKYPVTDETRTAINRAIQTLSDSVASRVLTFDHPFGTGATT
jgi:hypothetical protein